MCKPHSTGTPHVAVFLESLLQHIIRTASPFLLAPRGRYLGCQEIGKPLGAKVWCKRTPSLEASKQIKVTQLHQIPAQQSHFGNGLLDGVEEPGAFVAFQSKEPAQATLNRKGLDSRSSCSVFFEFLIIIGNALIAVVIAAFLLQRCRR